MNIFCRVSSCCCGCSLRTGSIIIGCFWAIFSICAVALEVNRAIETRMKIDDPINIDNINALSITFTLCIFGAVAFSLLFMICVVMLMGVWKNDGCLIIPWMIYFVVNLISSLGYAIFKTITDGFNKDLWLLYEIVMAILLLFYGLQWYILSVIYCYYKEISKSKFSLN